MNSNRRQIFSSDNSIDSWWKVSSMHFRIIWTNFGRIWFFNQSEWSRIFWMVQTDFTPSISFCGYFELRFWWRATKQKVLFFSCWSRDNNFFFLQRFAEEIFSSSLVILCAFDQFIGIFLQTSSIHSSTFKANIFEINFDQWSNGNFLNKTLRSIEMTKVFFSINDRLFFQIEMVRHFWQGFFKTNGRYFDQCEWRKKLLNESEKHEWKFRSLTLFITVNEKLHKCLWLMYWFVERLGLD